MKVKLFTVIFLILSVVSFSQKKEVNEQIEYLVRNKFSSLDIIDSVFITKRKNKELLELLVKRSEENSYLQGQFYGSNALGRYYRDHSLFNKSISQYKKALNISVKIKDTLSEVKILNSLGSVYRRQDDIRNALNYHQQALDKAIRIKNPKVSIKKSISISENSIGNIYIALKQYKLALNEFSKSIVMQKELGHKLGLAINHQNIGNAHEELGDLDKALQNYHKSLSYNNQINSKIGSIICGYSIANVLIKQKKYEQAFVTVDTVLQIAIKEKDKYYLSNTYNTLGLAQLNLNKLDEAKNSLTTALNIATDFNVHTIVVRANENLALLYDKKKNYKKAYSFYKKAKEEDAKTFNERNLLYVSELISKYDKEHSENLIKDLAKKNEIAQLQITRNRNLWIMALSIFALIAVVVFSIDKQKGLKNEKRILSLKQDALRSQMNPHFMFNALNSIKLYIIENDQKKATSYLNKFSKLMRKILEASSIQETTLAEEIETMNLYMSIENIRFSNEIDFTINADPSLNLETIKIPPLVLQPFLENSLWHGLSSKKEDKKMTIQISKLSSDYIQIDISDNGIGRKASAKIKAEKSINRKSVGINLTNERLTNFSKNLRNDYSIIYKDLVDENNNALGTKIIIKLPIS
ncbi:tetratricopeptide repeat protein [Polaribacter sp. Hel1_85]|uniref:tetratricopeptide repeat-containing sensor histidine kinase n=1 Tax=Polaribacter sp. Hel1_85 TaxID=1250005 RepID=UPI00052D2BE1|nr:tetratricopeptide repeat protein [Polaribacter sp. Hel1_85]KGL62619.1 two-component system sensor histidine kinase [Polaribacter sp. Hel1_85]